MKLKPKERDSERIIVLALLVLTLWVRLSTQMMIHTGVDERDYWYAAKALSQGFAYPDLTHRTVRWAIILPVAALQKIFGVHPNVYYIAPILNALAQTVLLYALGKRLRGRFVGILSAIFLIFFPYQIRAASQVRPEIFSITYMLLCAYFLILALHGEGRKRMLLIVASSLTLFLAYETKITNLFFLPGIFLAMLLYGGKTKVRDCFSFGLPLLGLFLVETALYATLTEFRFGQLSVISANHLSSDYADPLKSYWEVFLRYSPEYLQPYWQLPIALFVAAGIYYLAKGKNRELKTLTIMGFSFIFFITFTVTKLHPIMVAEDFINRYFCALLPFVFLVISWAVQDIAEHSMPSIRGWKASDMTMPVVLASVGLCVALSAVFTFPIVPSSARQYAHSPFRPSEHPFIQTANYYRELNDAWDSGTPILSAEGLAGENAAQTVCRFFLSQDTYSASGAPSPIIVTLEGTSVHLISKDGLLHGTTFIQAVRSPFRIFRIPLSRVSEIDPERSIQ